MGAIPSCEKIKIGKGQGFALSKTVILGAGKKYKSVYADVAPASDRGRPVKTKFNWMPACAGMTLGRHIIKDNVAQSPPASSSEAKFHLASVDTKNSTGLPKAR